MLDDTGIDMEYHVRGLIEAGVSPVKAVEYYMIEVKGLTKTEWVSNVA